MEERSMHMMAVSAWEVKKFEIENSVINGVLAVPSAS